MVILLTPSPQLCVYYLLLSRFYLFQPGLFQTCSAYSAVTIPQGMSSMQQYDDGFVSSKDGRACGHLFAPQNGSVLGLIPRVVP